MAILALFKDNVQAVGAIILVGKTLLQTLHLV
jgi:hypothetical protein